MSSEARESSAAAAAAGDDDGDRAPTTSYGRDGYYNSTDAGTKHSCYVVGDARIFRRRQRQRRRARSCTSSAADTSTYEQRDACATGTGTGTKRSPAAPATTAPSAEGSSPDGSLPRGGVESIDKLRAAVSKLQDMSDDDKASFIHLASRYLVSEVEERIDWSKIQQPTHEMVVPYDSLVPAPRGISESEISNLLSTLIVLKLNGGLGTNMD